MTCASHPELFSLLISKFIPQNSTRMKKIFLPPLLLISFFLHAQNYPFPQHITYTSGTIKPNNYTQKGLDNQVKKYYDKWKIRHLKAGCETGTYYVWYNDLGYDGNNIAFRKDRVTEW